MMASGRCAWMEYPKNLGRTSFPALMDLKMTFFATIHVPSRSKRYLQKVDSTRACPQRRPRDRSRTFIRAYAPVLNDCAIYQATWLNLVDAKAANPWLNAINLASTGTSFLPPGISIAISYTMQQATNSAIELHARDR